MQDEIGIIIGSYKLDDTDHVRKVISTIIECVRERDLPDNSNVFTMDFLTFDGLPKRKGVTNQMVCLILSYLRECPEPEWIKMKTSQKSGITKSLRDSGYLFQHNNAPEGKRKDYEYKNVDGVRCIKCTAMIPKEELELKQKESETVKSHCSTKSRKKFIEGKADPITGIRKHLQIDHRRSIRAHQELSTQPKKLTDEMVENGTANDHFQVISDSSNYKKREACVGCQRGDDIKPICPVGKYFQDIGVFKKKWRDDDKKYDRNCEFCMYYHLDNLGPFVIARLKEIGLENI